MKNMGISIIVILIMIILMITIRNSESYLSPKIVQLVLYSDSNDYKQMYEITRPYYQKYKVDTLYYMYSGTSDPPYVKDDILYLPGKESFIPGVLNKTINAFQWVSEHYEYDYILRSNISTVVDMVGVISALSEDKIDYGGGFVGPVVMSQGYGVKDKHVGTIYASGTSIILSKDFVDTLLKTRNEIDYDVIDDVAIGVWAKGKYEAKQLKGNLFYRNRSANRQTDVENIKNQVKNL